MSRPTLPPSAPNSDWEVVHVGPTYRACRATQREFMQPDDLPHDPPLDPHKTAHHVVQHLGAAISEWVQGGDRDVASLLSYVDHTPEWEMPLPAVVALHDTGMCAITGWQAGTPTRDLERRASANLLIPACQIGPLTNTLASYEILSMLAPVSDIHRDEFAFQRRITSNRQLSDQKERRWETLGEEDDYFALHDHYRGQWCGSAEQLVHVTCVDPEWGRVDHLWNTLADWATDEDSMFTCPDFDAQARG